MEPSLAAIHIRSSMPANSATPRAANSVLLLSIFLIAGFGVVAVGRRNLPRQGGAEVGMRFERLITHILYTHRVCCQYPVAFRAPGSPARQLFPK